MIRTLFTLRQHPISYEVGMTEKIPLSLFSHLSHTLISFRISLSTQYILKVGLAKLLVFLAELEEVTFFHLMYRMDQANANRSFR